MPRDLPLGNGSLLADFDGAYQLRDLYWPHVGSENHTNGHASRFGVWVDGRFSWVSDDAWRRDLRYEEDTLVSRVTLARHDLQLALICRDAVDFHVNLYVREITVRNQSDAPRKVRLFFGHDLHITADELGNTAYYEPERRALFHYKGKCWIMINGAKVGPEGLTIGLDQWAAGRSERNDLQGTWRDAEDGILSGNPVAQGNVDSTMALHLDVGPGGEAKAWYWMAVGGDFAEVTRINRAVREKGPATFLERTRHYWALWISKASARFTDLPGPIGQLYRRSLLIIRTQVDNSGAILAANDYDITQYGRDTYSYMWPRDGALAAAALDDAGYSEVPRRFFEFCHSVITEEGYLLHKYNPDGSLASSWHGWYHDGKKELPVQEDETGLVLWALWRHFERWHDVEFIKPLYRGLVIRAANWLAEYRDKGDGLPLPSWDLWEERRGVFGWTCGATWAGLQAAANFADAFGEVAMATGYRRAAEEIKAGVRAHLWSAKHGRFLRMIQRGAAVEDATADASLCGLWLFGMLLPDDPAVIATMRFLAEKLAVKTKVGGVARYENDPYQQASRDTSRIPGNPWFVCTLWLAEWHIAAAQNHEQLAACARLLNWAIEHALPSGVMAEQVHPETGAPLSVSPLTWSHAAFISAVHALEQRRAALGNLR